MQIPEVLERILLAIDALGGRPFLVGGCVRDSVLGVKPKDFDVEVFGLSINELQKALSMFGIVDLVGRSFGVLKLHSLPNVDFSVPRRDSKTGIGHRDFDVELVPDMSIEEAAARRDFTMNSMSWDPFAEKLIDPFFGQAHLLSGNLCATNPSQFLEDPLRVLRAAQFMSRFSLRPDPFLTDLCTGVGILHLPGERIFPEFEKLLRGKALMSGFVFLGTIGVIAQFPELSALAGCEQEPEWHPEGDVWTHTMLTLNAARGLTDDLTVLWAALLHDVGKPSTVQHIDGRIRTRGHAEAGVPIARNFLNKLRAPQKLIDEVCCLVQEHLAPSHFFDQKAGPAGFRRLARRLAHAGVSPHQLEMLSHADHIGSGHEAEDFPAGKAFLEGFAGINLAHKSVPSISDAVRGRDLIDRGFKPGPSFGQILQRCRELQDETGCTNKDELLAVVLRRDAGMPHG